MKKINFTKMVASGNDFIIIEAGHQAAKPQSYKLLAKKICDRKYGAGADGLLVLEKSMIADTKMRIFNADGSQAEMCGNGARCTTLFLNSILNTQYSILKIETKAGIIDAEVKGNNVKIKLTSPKNIKLDIPVKINNRQIKVNFINTGVPHAVIFVEGLNKMDIAGLGRNIRYHKKFMPAGTNVDFAEALNGDSIGVRTYERGVEDETLACGTGSVAVALLYSILNTQYSIHRINVVTKSGETLKVYFDRYANNFKNVWLEGRVSIVYKGEFPLPKRL